MGESWSVLFLSIMGGFISSTATASQSVLTNITVLFQMGALGINASTYVLIGKELTKDAAYARKQSKMVLYEITVFSLFVCAFMHFLGYYLICLFTDIEEVIVYTNDVIKTIYCFFFISTSWKIVQSGIIISMGKSTVAMCGIPILYLTGFPISYYTCFVLEWELVGLWFGMFCGEFILCCFYFYVINFRYNWDDLVIEA